MFDISINFWEMNYLYCNPKFYYIFLSTFIFGFQIELRGCFRPWLFPNDEGRGGEAVVIINFNQQMHEIISGPCSSVHKLWVWSLANW